MGTKKEKNIAADNCRLTKEKLGYVSRNKADKELYKHLGFKCGLEIHQQLKTRQKLFCHCPTGLYQDKDDYDAEIVRHMRPTLSEMGGYDGTALMEKKTRKNICYRIKNQSACTYDIDDTPPFKLNTEALDIGIEIALLLKTSVVGELHITRKQYLDGSIPTGFQRTAIIGIEGSIPLPHKKIRIIQISIEEDSCREISDFRHDRVYSTDRLGTPLIEMVTYPDMLTPDEAAEAGNHLRFLARSTGKVRTGIGATRQDVNVSIKGGTRIEIKGVAHIKWIPELTHNEMFRQSALLKIRQILAKKKINPNKWKIKHSDIDPKIIHDKYLPLSEAVQRGDHLVAVNLPGFSGLLSFFTQPGQVFADELSQRLKVIPCLERPNMLSSEDVEPVLYPGEWDKIRKKLDATPGDGQVLFWSPQEDIQTALETIEERCQMAFLGVPSETRKGLPDGTNIFERVLPGADRMYPDTDSAPIAIKNSTIEKIAAQLPSSVDERLKQLCGWGIPEDSHNFLLKKNLVEAMGKIIVTGWDANFAGKIFGHLLRNLEGKFRDLPFPNPEIYVELFKHVKNNKLDGEIIKYMLPFLYRNPEMKFDEILKSVDYKKKSCDNIAAMIPILRKDFKFRKKQNPQFEVGWLMENLKPAALGNISMKKLKSLAEKAVLNG